MIIKSCVPRLKNIDLANDGEQGLQAFKTRMNQENCDCGLKDCPNQFYSLIFMDLNMPVMDGFESARQMKQYYDEKNLKFGLSIVALTAYTNPIYI